MDPASDFADHVDALSSGEFNLANVALFYYAFTDLGEGCIDFDGVADALDDAGYDGHVTIEMEKQTTDTLVHAKQNVDYWRSVTGER